MSIFPEKSADSKKQEKDSGRQAVSVPITRIIGIVYPKVEHKYFVYQKWHQQHFDKIFQYVRFVCFWIHSLSSSKDTSQNQDCPKAILLAGISGRCKGS